MTTYESQLREVETFLDAAERVGIDRKEAAHRILRSTETMPGGHRKLWSDFQKIFAWASELAVEE